MQTLIKIQGNLPIIRLEIHPFTSLNKMKPNSQMVNPEHMTLIERVMVIQRKNLRDGGKRMGHSMNSLAKVRSLLISHY